MPVTWNMPARIDTARLTLRRYTGADAVALHAVVTANVEHLQPWMAWIHDEPQSLEQRRALIDAFNRASDEGMDFTLGMFDRDTGDYLGGTGLHVREGCPEIGFWIREDAQGHGYVTETAAALTCVTFEHLHAPRVYLANDPANARSVAVAQRLGMSVVSEGDEPAGPGGAMRPTLLWALEAHDYPDSPAAAFARPTMVDRDGEEMPWPALR